MDTKTSTTSSRDRHWVMEVAEAGRAAAETDRTVTALELIGERLGCEYVLLTDLADPSRSATVGPGPALPAEVNERLAWIITRHPLHAPVVLGSRHRPAPPLRLFDVVTRTGWQRHPVFAEVLGPCGLDHHTVGVAVAAGPPDAGRFCAFNRRGDWSEREMDLLSRLQPLLATWQPSPAGATGPRADGPLTRRELQVVQLVASGLTARAVGHRLSISPATVHKHLEHIHAKLGTSGPVSTVNAARLLGLLSAS